MKKKKKENYVMGHMDSPAGELVIASDGSSLKGIWIRDQKYFPDENEENVNVNEDEVIAKTKEWIDSYFRGEKPDPKDLPLAPEGSEFRKQVWDILLSIPYGETCTYGEIAQEIAEMRGIEKMSAQAVGGAVGHNPIAIVIPCHRVIGRDGDMTGYAGGLHVKKMLLVHEGLKVDDSGFVAKELLRDDDN